MKNALVFSFLLLFLVSFASCLGLDYDCPKSVNVGSEFECNLKVIEGSGVYDLKFDITKGSGSVGEIFDTSLDNFKSAYYYLKDFISNEEEKQIKLKVKETGSYDAYFKLRSGSKVEEFLFNLEVKENQDILVEEVGEKAEDKKEEEKLNSEVIGSGEIILESDQSIPLVLNSNKVKTLDIPKEIVYESKEYKTIKYLPYAFSLFLILIIGILLREKF